MDPWQVSSLFDRFSSRHSCTSSFGATITGFVYHDLPATCDFPENFEESIATSSTLWARDLIRYGSGSRIIAHNDHALGQDEVVAVSSAHVERLYEFSFREEDRVQMHEMTAIFHDEMVENCASINARIHLITLPGSGEKIRREGTGDVMLS